MTREVNAMESALAAARGGTLSSAQLLEALAAGEVWVPLPAGARGDQTADLPILWIDDERYIPVYTSAEEFGRSAGDMAYMVSPLRDLARALSPDLGIAVNPGGTVGLPIRPPGVDVLRGGKWTAPVGGRVRLGQPEVEPAALMEALKRAMARVREVESVRSAWAQFGDDPSGLLLGVILEPDSEAARQAALAAIAAARAQVQDPCSVDCVFGREPGDAVARWLASNASILYQRMEP
jgi:hypothetical protein